MVTRRTFVSGLLAQTVDEAQRMRIWDVHSHLHGAPGETPAQRMEFLVRCADRQGVERIILSQGYSTPLHPNPDELRAVNDRCCARCGDFGIVRGDRFI